MSKLLKIAIPLALLIFILAPGVTGFLVESSIEKAESGYGQALTTGPFELVDNSFDRGWFSSDQSMELNLTDPKLAAVLHVIGGHDSGAQMPSLVIDTTATHGVIPLANPSRGGLRPAIAQTESSLSLKYADGTQVPLPVKVYSSLGTGQWARMVADPISTSAPDSDATINWEGADISAKFGNTTSYEGSIGALNLQSDGAQIQTTPLTLEGKFKQSEYAFSESESSMSLDKVTVTPPAALGQGAIVVNNFRGMGTVEVDSGRAVAVSNISVGGITNSSLNIDGIEMVANYNVDAAALSSFVTESRKLQSAEAMNDDQAANAEATLAAMSDLIAKGASFKLEKFNIAVDGGTMSMDLDVNLPAGSNSPQAAMANGQAAGNVVIPESVVEALGAVSPEIAGGLTMAAMMGFVQQKEGAYRASVSYENGVLLLNDLPVPLPF